MGMDKLDDLEIAALLASKICHDIIGPVGAIYNGLEVLDEEGNDESSKAYALEVIRNFTVQASSKLQFARFAFGAAGSAGSLIDLTTAEHITRGFVETGKHTLNWNAPAMHMGKDKVKLLLNLVVSGLTALPRGGELTISVNDDEHSAFGVHCRGVGARPPQHLEDFISGEFRGTLDALTIQAYYTARLAGSAGMRLSVLLDASDIILTATPNT